MEREERDAQHGLHHADGRPDRIPQALRAYEDNGGRGGPRDGGRRLLRLRRRPRRRGGDNGRLRRRGANDRRPRGRELRGRVQHAHRAGAVPVGRGTRGRGGAGDPSRAAQADRRRGAQPVGRHPEGLPLAAFDRDEGRRGLEDNRLAPLGRRDASQGVRGPQPVAPRLDRTRRRSRGRSPAAGFRGQAVGDTRDHLAGRARAQEPFERRSRPVHRAQRGSPPGTDLRPRGGRGGAGGPRRGGLRGFGGPLHPRPRVDSLGRPGGHLIADRELPGLPGGPLRLRTRQPRAGPGRQVRRPDRGAPGGGRPEKGGRPLPYRALRGRRSGSARRDRRVRGPLPQAGGGHASNVSRA